MFWTGTAEIFQKRWRYIFFVEATWLMSREADQFSNETMSHIDGILEKNYIEKEAFLHVDQSSCSS